MGDRQLLRHGLGLGAALLGASALISPVNNPDLYWHLAAAREIARAGHPLLNDPFSWTLAGTPWVDFEWLSQLVYLAAHAAGGWAGLLAWKMAVFAALAAVLWRILAAQGNAPPWTGVLVLAAFTGLLPGLDVRPENHSLLLTVCLLYVLEKHRLGIWTWDRARWAAGFFLGGALWANLHAGFALGLGTLGLYAVGRAGRSGWRAAMPLTEAAGAAFLGTSLNPWGWRIYNVLFDHLRTAAQFQPFISEWQPPDYTNPWLWPFFALVAAAALALGARFLREREIVFEHLALVVVFGLGANLQSRHATYAVLASVVALGGLRLPPRAAWVGLSALWFFPVWVWPYRVGRVRGTQFERPGAVAFLKEHKAELAPLKMFNRWGTGGYLIHELHPDYKVFMDGRYPFVHFLPEEHRARSGPAAWNAFADKYGFELAVLDMEPDLDRFIDPGAWSVLYRDRRSIILRRRPA